MISNMGLIQKAATTLPSQKSDTAVHKIKTLFIDLLLEICYGKEVLALCIGYRIQFSGVNFSP